MKCKDVQSKLIFFLDEELPIKEMQAVQEHLNDCTDCALFAEDMKKTLSILETEKTPELNPFFYTRVKAKMENRETERVINRRPVLVRVLQPVAFSIVLLIGIYAGIKLGASGSAKTSNTVLAQQEMIPYWNGLDAEPIETFLME
ncbi:zf-HC2 domain-containing protein [Maribellus mangrovi]|uniref:zf-HC2 domain-containing protein n=1 Tax=Maribellus mangrovi TaxID=3133146 RepID=UPI0030EB5951